MRKHTCDCICSVCHEVPTCPCQFRTAFEGRASPSASGLACDYSGLWQGLPSANYACWTCGGGSNANPVRRNLAQNDVQTEPIEYCEVRAGRGGAFAAGARSTPRPAGPRPQRLRARGSEGGRGVITCLTHTFKARRHTPCLSSELASCAARSQQRSALQARCCPPRLPYLLQYTDNVVPAGP